MPNQFGFSIESETIQPQKQFKVLLIGDSCIDKYVYCSCDRLSPEAPVPVLVEQRVQQTRGMAWNVRDNLLSFGVEVYIMTNQNMPVKTRYVDIKSNQQVMRLDQNDEVDEFSWDLPTEKFDALVISDYNKGLLSEERLFDLVEWFDGPTFIDSKKTHLPRNCFLKLNDLEAKKLTGVHPHLITTKGSEGATYRGITYPGVKVPVFDVAGAGDTFLSALVYFYLKHGRIEDAIPYANKCAAVAVRNSGTYVLSENDIIEICN